MNDVTVTSGALRRAIGAVLMLACSMAPARGHEFWIDPVAFAVASGEPIVADLIVGQVYDGIKMSYRPQSFRRFEIAQGDGVTPVAGRMGDIPALRQVAGPGLAVVLHVTGDSRLSYSDFDKFEEFVREKDAAWTIAAHAERGLPATGFGEVYSRYAKALVAVDAGTGADRAFGLETEFVARLNPYTDDLSGGLPVALYYRGAPRAGAQIEVFEKDADGAVRVFPLRTDAAGMAVVPVQAGRRYMLDAVVLRAPAPDLAEARNAVWESLWANLTFAVPDG